MKKFDVVSFIIEYESGESTPNEVVKGFSQLKKKGLISTLQGAYGRFFEVLVEEGYLSHNGDILKLPEEEE